MFISKKSVESIATISNKLTQIVALSFNILYTLSSYNLSQMK